MVDAKHQLRSDYILGMAPKEQNYWKKTQKGF